MPVTSLDIVDAIEPAELLQFISDWLAFDPENLTESMALSAGNAAYGPGTLRDDLARFIFLLGGSDGERFFGPLK